MLIGGNRTVLKFALDHADPLLIAVLRTVIGGTFLVALAGGALVVASMCIVVTAGNAGARSASGLVSLGRAGVSSPGR